MVVCVGATDAYFTAESLARKIKAIDPLVNEPIFSAYSMLGTVLANTFTFMSVS